MVKRSKRKGDKPTKIEGMEDYKSVAKWINQTNGRTCSNGTRKVYLYHLKSFCDEIGIDPDQLIAERKTHLKSDEEETKREHEEMVMDYFNKMDKKHSRSYALTRIATIRSFYQANFSDLKLPKLKGWVTHQDLIPSLEQISQMVGVSDSALQRALILFGLQSGQRSGIITSITYGMVREQLEKNESLIVIEVSPDLRNPKGERVNKNRVPYHFCVGRDTIDCLKSYLKTREVAGDEIKDDSYLFVTERRNRRSEDEPLEFRPLDGDSINKMIKRSALKAGLITGEEKRSPIHSHTLRKRWKTQVEAGGMDRNWAEYMMGHSQSSLNQVYSQPDVEQLIEAYKRAESYLSISHVTKGDMEDLKQEMFLDLLKRDAELMGMDPTKFINKLKELKGATTIEDEINVLREEIIKITQKTESGKHKRVSEEELEEYLDHGWEIANPIPLPSGKILIKLRKSMLERPYGI